MDLPGTIAGHTALPNRRAAGIESSGLFLCDFADALELQRVVVHGWSAGGAIALLFADQALNGSPESCSWRRHVLPR
ncbi:alpha/beta fold hydrolase [Kribbella endophytica]